MRPIEFIAGDEKRFYEFMAGLDEKDKIGIFTHIDPDGITSAVIASRVLGKIDFLEFVNYSKDVYSKFIPKLKEKKINKIFFLDLEVSLEKEAIKEMEKFAEIVIIDHHPFDTDLNSDKTVFLKAESSYPAAYMCHYLFSKIQKIPSWIAALGIVADKPNIYGEKNYMSAYSDFNLPDKKDIWGIVMDFSFTIISFGENLRKAYDLLMKSESPDKLELGKYAEAPKKEFERYIKKFETEKEVYGDLILFYMNPKFGIKSLLVNVLSAQDKDKIYVFIKDAEPLSISARCQNGKYSCPDLLKGSVKDISDSFAGGHRAAAAARVPKRYLSQFKENLIREYKKLGN